MPRRSPGEPPAAGMDAAPRISPSSGSWRSCSRWARACSSRESTAADGEAVRHAFRVASSLDSMMIGEPQILGQVKNAFALAQSCETVGPALHTLFTQAFTVAKKVRTETEIARHAVSISFAAVELAK